MLEYGGGGFEIELNWFRFFFVEKVIAVKKLESSL